MNTRFKPWRRLVWALPMIALLAGCDTGKDEKAKPHAIATYVGATWENLPAVSD
ncbi:MAG: transglycosylase, partial [Pseudomonas sp.]